MKFKKNHYGTEMDPKWDIEKVRQNIVKNGLEGA